MVIERRFPSERPSAILVMADVGFLIGMYTSMASKIEFSVEDLATSRVRTGMHGWGTTVTLRFSASDKGWSFTEHFDSFCGYHDNAKCNFDSAARSFSVTAASQPQTPFFGRP